MDVQRSINGFNAGQNLYLAVIQQTLLDVQSIVEATKREVSEFKVADIRRKKDKETLLMEINHEHFKTICANAGVSHERVMDELLDAFDTIKWHGIKFVNLRKHIDASGIHRVAKYHPKSLYDRFPWVHEREETV